jgi:nucleotide-binding universal stress UspA family protein
MYTRFLVPTDGSQLSDRALREAGELARTLGRR